jgi:hypothetical protein
MWYLLKIWTFINCKWTVKWLAESKIKIHSHSNVQLVVSTNVERKLLVSSSEVSAWTLVSHAGHDGVPGCPVYWNTDRMLRRSSCSCWPLHVSSWCQLGWTPCHRYCSCRSAQTPLDPSGGSSYDVTGFSSLYTACRISRRWTWSWSDQEWRWNQSRAYIGKVSYYDGCNWLFLFVSCFLIGSFLAIWLVKFPVMWLVGDIKHFNPLLG